MEDIRSAGDNVRSIWNCSVKHLFSLTIQFSDKIVQVLPRCIRNNHYHFPISFPRVQLLPDRVRLNMVSKQHGSVDEDHQRPPDKCLSDSHEPGAVPGSQTLKI